MEVRAHEIADFARYRVEPGEQFSIAGHDPADTGNFTAQDEVEREYESLVERIGELQERLYAEEERSLLIVLQGIDAAGKDGTVKHVLSGTIPSGVHVFE